MLKTPIFIFCILTILLAGCSIDDKEDKKETIIFPLELSFCDSFPEYSDKKACYMDFASKTNNVSVCDELLEEYRAFCYSIVALENNDLSICKESKKYSQYCYSTFASKTNNLHVCNECDKSSREFCYANFALKNNNLSVCDILPGKEKLDCYIRFAGNIHDLSVCDKLKGSKNVTLCYAYFAFYEVHSDEDINDIEPTCNKMSKKENREECITLGKELLEDYDAELYRLE